MLNVGTACQKLAKAVHSWDMGVQSHLTWLLLFSPDVAPANRTAPVHSMVGPPAPTFGGCVLVLYRVRIYNCTLGNQIGY